ELVNYDFDPKAIVSEKEKVIDNDGTKREYTIQEAYDISKDLPGPNENRKFENNEEIHIVLSFKGESFTSFDGSYEIDSASFSLWEDGLFSGYSGKTIYKGYWYYSYDEIYSVNSVIMIDVSGGTKNMLQAFDTSYKGNDYKLFGCDYVLNLLPERSAKNIYELFGYFYKPVVGLFLLEIDDEKCFYENGWMYGYWAFQVTSDLRAVKITDHTELRITTKVKYLDQIFQDKAEITMVVEWQAFIGSTVFIRNY
ncbi:MAG: hypothetical protein HUJ63_09110, partial [Enterococcus sp.]|nr:hypothetical protein [Enterococcus sp.]